MKKRRFLGMLLTLVMIIVMLPATANADESNALYGSSPDNITTAGNLSEIISSQQGTVYIKLTANVALTEDITITQKTINIDLAGFTVTMAANGAEIYIKTNGVLAMTDTSSGKSGMVYSEYQGAIFNTYPASTLDINGGNYKAETGNIISAVTQSTVTINGGVFETTGKTAVAFTIAGNNSSLNINGGSFKAFSAETPNIRYRYGQINVTDFDAALGNLYVQAQGSSTESIALSSFVTLGSGLMTTDKDGAEITEIIGNQRFRIAPVHEIKYDLNGGSSSNPVSYRFPVPGTISVPTLDMVTPPSGKALSHWESNGTRYEGGDSVQITAGGSTTFKAIWQDQVQYTVTLHANNGTTDKITSLEWSLYTLPEQLPDGWTIREGNYLAGWSETKGGTTITGQVLLKGDTEFYAKYNKITYYITFMAEGATYVPAKQLKTYDVDMTFTERIPEREGYDFMGWEDPETGTIYQPGDTYKENKALTLYAVWKIKTYEVSFVAEGATNVPENQIKNYGETLKISEQKPTKNGYIFMGWASEKDGAVELNAGDDYTENNAKVLYAVWRTAKLAVVSYDATDKTATVELLEAGTYTVVFADYEGDKLANSECVSVTVSETGLAVAGITGNFTLGKDDKIMLWKDVTSLSPLCEVYIVE